MASMTKNINIDELAKDHWVVTIKTTGRLKLWIRVKAVGFLIWMLSKIVAVKITTDCEE